MKDTAKAVLAVAIFFFLVAMATTPRAVASDLPAGVQALAAHKWRGSCFSGDTEIDTKMKINSVTSKTANISLTETNSRTGTNRKIFTVPLNVTPNGVTFKIEWRKGIVLKFSFATPYKRINLSAPGRGAEELETVLKPY